MASRASSGYYRRNSYRRKKWRNILIASICVAVAVLLAFLIIGNILNKKTSDSSEDTERPIYTHQTTHNQQKPISPAYNVSIKGKSIDVFSAKLKDDVSALSQNGYNAVSFNLSDKDGSLLFSSKIGAKFGYPMKSDGIDLAAVHNKISSSGLRTSAVFTLNSFSEKDEKTRSVLRACEAAIACEVLQAGIDDVIVRCSDIKAEYVEELIFLADQVKRLDPKAVIGLSVTPQLLDGENASETVEKILSSFDFIAMEIVDTSDKTDKTEQIKAFFATDKYYYILRYNIRVLLPEADNEEQSSEMYKLMNDNNITNWQTVS